MLKITVQKDQAILLTGDQWPASLTVLHVDVDNDEVRLQLKTNRVEDDFTMCQGQTIDLMPDVKLTFGGIGHYTSAARDVNYARLGFEAPRRIKIQGEWNVRGHK